MLAGRLAISASCWSQNAGKDGGSDRKKYVSLQHSAWAEKVMHYAPSLSVASLLKASAECSWMADQSVV